MFIKQNLVLNSIEYFKEFNYTENKSFSRKSLGFYLLLKGLKFNKYNSVSKVVLNEPRNKNLTKELLFKIGGIFDLNEYAKKKSCIFFSCYGYDKIDTEFFNGGTSFKELSGRLNDTIDNSINGILLRSETDSDGVFHYTLKNDVEKIILKNYNKKNDFFKVACWLYRATYFEEEISIEMLKFVFLKDFNMTDNEFSSLFYLDKTNKLEFETSSISGKLIRNKLGLSQIEEFEESSDSNYTFLKNEFKIQKKNIQNYIGGITPMINQDYLKGILEKYKQLILTGVPGTGKSYLTEELEKKLNYKVRRIQFHPNYTYQDFIIGRTLEDNSLKYNLGSLTKIILEALESQEEKFLLIIDEINRGDLSSIFGELIYLLDRKGEIDLLNEELMTELGFSSSKIKLPENLYIIGTMNSADRSIALIDYAIRRRFLFVDIEPNYSLLDNIEVVFQEKREKILGIFLKKVNENILKILDDADLRIGHALLMNGSTEMEIQELYEIIHFKLKPTILEYTYGKKEDFYNILTHSLLEAQTENLIQVIKDFINE